MISECIYRRGKYVYLSLNKEKREKEKKEKKKKKEKKRKIYENVSLKFNFSTRNKVNEEHVL